MTQKMLAVIRESECIGCTKCIEACPVDAILGSAKLMHTIIGEECIGCKLCIPPCPVDCIDLIPLPPFYQRIPAAHIKQRHQAKKSRLAQEEDTRMTALHTPIQQRKGYIQAALARAKVKK